MTMLKKVSHIIVSVLLLIATTGFTTYKHYCGEELMTENVLTDQEECCDEALICCHEEVESFQIDFDFISSCFGDTFELVFAKISLLQESAFNAPVKEAVSFISLDPSWSPNTNHKVQPYLQVFIL